MAWGFAVYIVCNVKMEYCYCINHDIDYVVFVPSTISTNALREAFNGAFVVQTKLTIIILTVASPRSAKNGVHEITPGDVHSLPVRPSWSGGHDGCARTTTAPDTMYSAVVCDKTTGRYYLGAYGALCARYAQNLFMTMHMG